MGKSNTRVELQHKMVDPGKTHTHRQAREHVSMTKQVPLTGIGADYGDSYLNGIEFSTIYRSTLPRHDQITQLLTCHLESTELWSNRMVYPFPVSAL